MMPIVHFASFHLPLHSCLPNGKAAFRLALVLGFCCLAGLSSAQSADQFDLTYPVRYSNKKGDLVEGAELTVQVQFRPKGREGNLISQKTGIIVTGGEEKTGDFVILFKSLNRIKSKGKGYQLEFQVECHNLTGPLLINKGQSQIFDLEELNAGDVLHRVSTYGAGYFSMNLWHRVYHKDSELIADGCSNSINLIGKIEDIVDPLELSLDKAIANPYPTSILEVKKWMANNPAHRLGGRALQFLKTQADTLYRGCLEQNDSIDCKGFLQHFNNDQRKPAVLAHLESLRPQQVVLDTSGGNAKKKPVLPPCKKAWNELVRTHGSMREIPGPDLERYQQQFPDCAGVDIGELIAEKKEIAIERVEKTGNTYVYKLAYVKNPRWKDISLYPGMEVDDSQLLSENKLAITLKGNGKFRLKIEDEWGKSEIISMANILDAVVRKISDDLYQLFIEGGSAPYRVELKNSQTFEVEKTIPGVQDSLTLDKELLKELTGARYNIWVYDATQNAKTRANLPLEIPAKEDYFIIYVTIGVLALIALTLIFYLITKMIRNRRT